MVVVVVRESFLASMRARSRSRVGAGGDAGLEGKDAGLLLLLLLLQLLSECTGERGEDS
jgi:hypothetical protein